MQLRPGKTAQQADKPAQVLICPSDPTSGGLLGLGALPYGFNSSAYWAQRSVNINYELDNYVHLSSVRSPSSTLVFSEIQWWKQRTNHVRPARRSDGTYYSWQLNFLNDMPREWHSETVNTTFLDGHVTRLEIQSLYPDEVNEVYWYKDR
ncbi:MAG TPA: hypothetical protein VF184_11905 [Phycisphaeraceae bacterium]